MIWGILGQLHRERKPFCKLNEPFEELGAMALNSRPVIQVDHQGLHMPKPFSDALPPLLQHIDSAITGDFGGDTGQKEVIRLGHQDAHRSHGGMRFEIVIARFDGYSLLASS